MKEKVANPCQCCEAERRKKGRPLRPLVALPEEVTLADVFKKNDGCSICEFCDGDALPRALAAHKKRSSG